MHNNLFMPEGARLHAVGILLAAPIMNGSLLLAPCPPRQWRDGSAEGASLP